MSVLRRKFTTAIIAAYLLVFLPTAGLGQVETANTKGTSTTITLFSQANVIDVETGGVLPDRDVLVGNGQIISIKKHDDAGIKKQRGLLVIPAQGKYLMPGLIDCHTHIFYKQDLLPYLSNAVTAVFSLGQPQEVFRFREEIKRCRYSYEAH